MKDPSDAAKQSPILWVVCVARLILTVTLFGGCIQHRIAADIPISLPIRFHLLRSKDSDALTTTRTEADVRLLVALANAIWAQAGISWHVESVMTEEGLNGKRFDSLIVGTLPLNNERLIAMVPRNHLLIPGWNVFLIRNFGDIAGGTFRPEIGGVILAEHGAGSDLPASGRGGATLAHELGHSLGLAHVPCDLDRNIMANKCWSSLYPSGITPAQIEVARAWASRGMPIESP